MRFLRPDEWDGIGLANPAVRFFYERWLECLDAGVPVSNRAPVMSTIGILKELIHLNNREAQEDWGKGAVKAVDDEAFGINVQPFGAVRGVVEADLLAEELAPDLFDALHHVTKHFISGGAPNELAAQRRSILLRLVLERLEETYLPAVLDRLQKALFVESLEPGSLKRIDQLTTSLVSELLQAGFTDSFLRTHSRMLEAGGSLPATEAARFEVFRSRLLKAPQEVQVVFRIQGSKALWDSWPNSLAEPTETPVDPPTGSTQEWTTFSRADGGVRFLAFTTQCQDHHAAPKLAYQMLQEAADLAFVRKPTPAPILLEIATLRGIGDVPKIAVIPENRTTLGDIPQPKAAKARAEEQAQIASAFQSHRVTNASKRRLAGAMKYYRISVGQSWLESSFTNLWTALEVLASVTYGDNIIERVVRSLVPLLSAPKIRDTSDDLLGYLLGIGVHRDRWFRENFSDVFVEQRIEPVLLLGALSEKDRAVQLIHQYGPSSPLIGRRIMQYHEVVSSGSTISSRVYRTARRIEWQIRRLYRLRNDIVHGAGVAVNGERLLSQLQLYVYGTLLVEGLVLGADNGLNSIEEVVAAGDNAFHTWMDHVRGLPAVSSLEARDLAFIYRPAYTILL